MSSRQEAADNRQKEVRCPKCRALLYKGKMNGEIKCQRCGYTSRYKQFDEA